MKFIYTAVDQSGKKLEGGFEAENVRAVLEFLARRGRSLLLPKKALRNGAAALSAAGASV